MKDLAVQMAEAKAKMEGRERPNRHERRKAAALMRIRDEKRIMQEKNR